MKHSFVSTFMAISFLWGCSVIPKNYDLPRFSYNNKEKNSFIINRIPDYGDTRRDGCVVMNEMQLYLTTADKKFYSGRLIDVTTQDPLDSASIRLTFYNSSDTISLQTDNNGEFSFKKNSEIETIQASLTGYRSITIHTRRKL